MKSRPFVILILKLLVLSSCGKAGPSAKNPVAQTLDFIRQQGFPQLQELLPTLPPQMALISGVDTDDSGLPVIPNGLSGASFGSSVSGLNTILSDAQQLSAQGFSETRRLEAMVYNLAGPIYDLLGQKNIFSFNANEEGEADQSDDQNSLTTLGDRSVSDIFAGLANNLSYAVKMNETENMPAYLLFGVDADSESILIKGLWPEGEEFISGFQAKVRIHSLDDLAVTLTLAPGLIGGFLPKWNASGCKDDLWQVSFDSNAVSGQSLSILNQECPEARNTISRLEFARSDSEDWTMQGGFTQTYAELSADSLRGWLGERQGFVVQAAASPDLGELAAAAAVLGEDDFSRATQETINQFGVGQLLANFFQQKYLKPKIVAAEKGNIFTQYENPAYWLCLAPVIANAVEGEVEEAANLCRGDSVDVEPTLAVMSELSEAVDSSSLVPSDIKTSIGTLVKILSIRNSLFVSQEGELHFKHAPNEAFAALDQSRLARQPLALNDDSWRAEADDALPRIQADELPDSPYKAAASGLAKFLREQCEILGQDTASKAGKTIDASSLCEK